MYSSSLNVLEVEGLASLEPPACSEEVFDTSVLCPPCCGAEGEDLLEWALLRVSFRRLKQADLRMPRHVRTTVLAKRDSHALIRSVVLMDTLDSPLSSNNGGTAINFSRAVGWPLTS